MGQGVLVAEWPAWVAELDNACNTLQQALNALTLSRPLPTFTGDRWDFGPPSLETAVLCISAKAVSSLHAAAVLWSARHLQETWAMLRILIECTDDVTLLCMPIKTPWQPPTPIQSKKIAEFFHDGTYAKPASKPDMVRRDSISAEVGNQLHAATGLFDPHRAITGIKRLHQIFSSYVHPSYVAVMSLGAGRPGDSFHFQALGSRNNRETGELLLVVMSEARNVAETLEMASSRLDSNTGAGLCRTAQERLSRFIEAGSL